MRPDRRFAVCYSAPVTTEPPDPPYVSTRQRVLVADDHGELRQLWRAYLTLSGFVVSEAADGAEAVAKAIQESPAVVLMDFRMPGMDGAAAARALKGDPRTAAIPVIGLTAHGTALPRLAKAQQSKSTIVCRFDT